MPFPSIRPLRLATSSLLLLLCALAHAQPAPPPAAANTPAKRPAGSAAVDGTAPTPSGATAAAPTAADAALLSRDARRIYELSRDKLVQIRPQLNMADRATGELNGGQKDALTQVIESGTAIHKLREAADQCIGEPVLGDESTNSFTHPPINDPTGTNPWTTVFEPPAYASAVN